MKRIYNFEKSTPPVLTEQMLKERSERRRLQRQTFWLYFASALVYVGMLFAALVAWRFSHLMAIGIVSAAAFSLIFEILLMTCFIRWGAPNETTVEREDMML